jgi:hypothetical protein
VRRLALDPLLLGLHPHRILLFLGLVGLLLELGNLRVLERKLLAVGLLEEGNEPGLVLRGGLEVADFFLAVGLLLMVGIALELMLVFLVWLVCLLVTT